MTHEQHSIDKRDIELRQDLIKLRYHHDRAKSLRAKKAYALLMYTIIRALHTGVGDENTNV